MVIGQGRCMATPAAGSDLWLQCCDEHIAFRGAVGDHRSVGVERRSCWLRPTGYRCQDIEHGDVLKRPRGRRRMRQHNWERLSALDPGLAPNDFLHTLIGFHPRATRLTPPRRTRNSFFKAKLVGKCSCILEEAIAGSPGWS